MSLGGKPVTVVGGTGFVGSRVCKILSENGASVTSVSKSGRVPEWCSGEAWINDVKWNAANLLEGSEEELDTAIGKPEVIVSCVGVVGTDADELRRGNGDTNVAAFASAKRGGSVERSALVSVASEVRACQENWLPDFFDGYFDGKDAAEQAALDAVGGDETKVCIVKPTFIYGGDSFGLLPPRVTSDYGSGIEELLSFGLITSLADATPGLIKVALRPPVSVDAVSGACASVVTESTSGVIEGAPAINAAAKQPKATGLTEALKWSKEELTKAYEWAKVEVPKAIKVVKGKIE
eukprot:CAMPEP_0194383846 /NCGR_PEP_ID=MMETSP0174-20130528/70221_1 /TAXON_ID=216777 /ORGANISM="Proboscia alata, Strain PI-D3" /LENGTH=293 /DNA_ID=CAMNT_0039170479 /DNA_START=197 /DNA_END=1078 /DNA_ORIENTATION=-